MGDQEEHLVEVSLFKLVKLDTLRHRDTARKVVEGVSGVPMDEEVVIDFSGIAFASRAFCNELLRGLEGRRVTFKNMGSDVDTMVKLARVKLWIKPRTSFTHKKLGLVPG